MMSSTQVAPGGNTFDPSMANEPLMTARNQVMQLAGDAPIAETVDTLLDPTLMGAETTDDQLRDFLRRPTLVDTFTWSLNVSSYTGVDIWTAFLGHPHILPKLQSYKYFRAKLRVRILVNGTPFNQGLILAAYEPFPDQQVVYTGANDLEKTVRQYQYQHELIDIHASNSCELEVPYFHYLDAINLDSIGRPGTVRLSTLVPPKHSNGGTDPIVLQVYVWAEDVHLYLPVYRDTPLVAQAGDSKEPGIVETTASAVAAGAKAFQKISWLRPFAKATEIGASAMSSIAHIFGWTRPATQHPIRFVKAIQTTNMAVTEGEETVMPLAVDPKQEVTVDPRVVGLGNTDEMTIEYMGARDGIVTMPTWDTSSSAGTLITSFPVGPNVTFENFFLVPTPLSFVSLFFKYWRADLVYTVRVVGSAYHRGRLQFMFNPSSDIPSLDDTNVTYSQVCDISEAREFEMRVKYCSSTPYLHYGDFIQGFGDSYNSDWHLGNIFLRVLTPLQAPTSTSSISVVVSVRAENLQVRDPSDTFTWYDYADPTPIVAQSGELVPTQGTGDQRDLIHFGEKIESFRTLLKRYTFYASRHLEASIVPNTSTINVLHHPHYPVDWHEAFEAVDTDGGGGIRAFTRPAVFHFLRKAFVAMRGGCRYKMLSQHDIGYYQVARRSANTTNAPFTVAQKTHLMNDLDKANYSVYDFPHFAPGAIAHNATVRTAEVNMPYYNPVRFTFCQPIEMGKTLIQRIAFPEQLDWFSFTTEGAWGADSRTINFYTAMNDDFSFFYFLAAPILKRNASNPPFTPP